MKEIELKFKLNDLPDPSILGKGKKILQGYLENDIRLRKKGDEFFMTVKGPGDLVRKEWEVEIPKWVFVQLWPRTKGRRLIKTRYEVALGHFKIEVDEFFGRLAGLVLLECEFKHLKDVKKFKLPSWARDAVDVTKDKRFSNKNLAEKGLP
jgi:adenylate cyclase